jgi:hypothetical protein
LTRTSEAEESLSRGSANRVRRVAGDRFGRGTILVCLLKKDLCLQIHSKEAVNKRENYIVVSTGLDDIRGTTC